MIADLATLEKLLNMLLIEASDANSGPNQTYKVETLAKIENNLKLLTFSAKRSILNVWLGSEFLSVHWRCYDGKHSVNWKFLDISKFFI